MESGRKSTGRTVTFKPAEEDGFQIGAGNRATFKDRARQFAGSIEGDFDG
jgi:hypothetical protein